MKKNGLDALSAQFYGSYMLRMIDRLGGYTNSKFSYLFYLASVTGAVLSASLQPWKWRRTARDVAGRQIMFTGIQAVSFVGFLALVAGLSLVTQSQLWLSRIGGGEWLGAMLASALSSHLGPLVVNFVVIGRSGTAIATELATMKINGDLTTLDRQGVDILHYLVVPRVTAMALSTLLLTVLFIVVALMSGYMSAVLAGNLTSMPGVFLGSVVGELERMDFFTLLAKTLIPGFATGVICCVQGLSVAASYNDVPRASTRAVVQSITALFCITAVITFVSIILSADTGIGHE